jgi:hypothetical protein
MLPDDHVGELLEALSDSLAHPDAVLPLTGGLTDAVTLLVWPRGGEPVVVKAAPSAQVEHEHRSRRLHPSASDYLAKGGLEHLGESVEIEGRQWRAIAYPYFGGRTYAELRTRTDFEELAKSYVDEGLSVDQRVPRVTIAACVEQVADKLLSARPIGSPATGGVAMPLSHYLPTPSWALGIRSALAIASRFTSSSLKIDDIESWWVDGASSMKVAPMADWRYLHGDARFANILVDRLNATTELIDYGNGKEGHVFEDLARFEVDLVLRAVPSDTNAQLGSVHEGLGVCTELSLFPVEDDVSAKVRLLRIWRHALNERLSLYSKPGALQMYLWFVLAEFLKRLRWLTPGDIEGPGASPEQLLDAIVQVRAALEGEVSVRCPSSALDRYVSKLGCSRVYVPTRGDEFAVNEARNEAKRRLLAESASSQDHVTLIAETGNSYLHVRGPFHASVRELLTNGGRLSVIVADILGDAGLQISRSYGGALDGLHPDLRRKFEESHEGYRFLRDAFGDRIQGYVAPLLPGGTVLSSRWGAFYEPYFYSNRSHRQATLFDTFELEFSPESHMMFVLGQHFDSLVRNCAPLA